MYYVEGGLNAFFTRLAAARGPSVAPHNVTTIFSSKIATVWHNFPVLRISFALENMIACDVNERLGITVFGVIFKAACGISRSKQNNDANRTS